MAVLCARGRVVALGSVERGSLLCRLYAVSLAYKESPNCRLEANYAHQQAVDMIPLMMQESYQPAGWLGLILGGSRGPSLALLCNLLWVKTDRPRRRDASVVCVLRPR